MFGSSVLDVAIGLAFLYLLLSLLSTGINEYIESWIKMRAKDLERGLRELLAVGAPTATGATPEGLIRQLYSHPLIYALFHGEYQSGARNLPSYIPSRNFALALMDVVLPARPDGTAADTRSGTCGATAPRQAVPDPTAVAAAAAAVAAVAGGPSGAVALTPAPGPVAAPDSPVTRLRAGVVANRTLTPDLQKALLALIDAAGNDMNQVRENIERWFDSAMDRVSGWYKRRVQWITLGVGFALAVAINADTFAVGESLARDQALRASVVAAAEQYAQTHNPQPAGGKAAEGKGKEANEKGKDKDTTPLTPEKMAEEVNKIQGYGWPLGWYKDDKRTMPPDVPGWALKFFGWVLTAFAISLGAPFWFDLLNRFIVIRSTVRPTQKSPPEPPVNPPNK
jgi:hypothetical protein